MRRALLCILSLGLTAACGGGDQKEAEAAAAGDAPAGGAAASTGPTGSAVVSGTIRFAGTAPANPTIDMSEEAACAQKYGGTPVDSQYVVSDGGLGNVLVYVKSGLPDGATYAAPSEPVVIDQNGCKYRPRVLAIHVGQPLEIRNSDPLLHNIKAVPTQNRGFNISQPTAGMKTTRTFNTPEVVVPLECNVHGWMNAYVGVMSHPFHAVSTPDGKFTIRNLPAGTYTIEAWHEKLGTQTTTVTVGDGETKTADLNFAPKA